MIIIIKMAGEMRIMGKTIQMKHEMMIVEMSLKGF